MDNESVVRELENMEREAKKIKDDLIRICWYMRGGITYNEAHELSLTEKNMIMKLIDENLEMTKKSGMPFF